MQSNLKVFFLSSLLFPWFVSCTNDYNKNKNQAGLIVEIHGSQNPELKKLYDYAVENRDGDILFLLANIVNKTHNEDNKYTNQNGDTLIEKIVVNDLRTVVADSVILSVENSRTAWAQMPWADEYPEEYFREYVLPYHPFDTELKSPGKEYIYSESFDGFDEQAGILENAMAVNVSAVQLPDAPNYYCDHWTRYSITALRAAGIPAAEHSIVRWGDMHAGHSAPALLLPDGSFMHFEEADLPKNTLVRPMPKLYRRMYSIQDNTLVYKRAKKESIPPAFAGHNLKDVTDKFPIDTKNIKIKIPKDRDKKSQILYLSVFAREGWFPIAYAEKKGRSALFERMGTGHQQNGDFISNGRDIGEGIVYLPGFYIKGQVVPVGDPIIVGKGSERVLEPDTENRQTMVLNRKFPLKSYTLIHHYHMLGGMFEASVDPDFEQRDTLYTIYETPKSTYQTIDLEPGKKYKYARYRVPYGVFSISEMKFFDPRGDTIRLAKKEYFNFFVNATLTADVMLSDGLSDLYNLKEESMDNNQLSYVTTDISSYDLWLGVEFEKPTQIARIEFSPRTDGNDIAPGDEYELLYWDDGWIGMGRRIAQGYELIYENVPSNALYWLRNYTQGQEERPFTYENGKQIWW